MPFNFHFKIGMEKNPMRGNPCTQMAICFSAEMKIESKNYSIAIFIYSKIEKKKKKKKLKTTY